MLFVRVALIALLALPFAAEAAAPPTQFLPRPGGMLAYDDWGGGGRLVIAAPGMGDLRAEYRFLAPLLKQAGLRVVTLDVRGMGQSSADWNDYSARAVASDMAALLDHLGGGKAILIGTSFAAGAAAWAAHDAPQKVAGIVLISPVVRDPPAPFWFKPALWLGFAGPWRSGLWLSYWDSLLPLRKPEDHAAYREALRANLREAGRMNALHTMLTLSKADTAAMLPRLHVPSLIIMGSADPDFAKPTDEAADLSQELGASTLLVPGAGHYPHVETPEPVAQRIIAFSKNLP
jgi:pimeloyl-ACP methyl ester carboxylesterase